MVQAKTCLKWSLSKRQIIGFQDQLSLNAGQKYYRKLPLEHSAILSSFSKPSFVIQIFVLSILRGRLNRFYCYLTLSIQAANAPAKLDAKARLRIRLFPMRSYIGSTHISRKDLPTLIKYASPCPCKGFGWYLYLKSTRSFCKQTEENLWRLVWF